MGNKKNTSKWSNAGKIIRTVGKGVIAIAPIVISIVTAGKVKGK